MERRRKSMKFSFPPLNLQSNPVCTFSSILSQTELGPKFITCVSEKEEERKAHSRCVAQNWTCLYQGHELHALFCPRICVEQTLLSRSVSLNCAVGEANSTSFPPFLCHSSGLPSPNSESLVTLSPWTIPEERSWDKVTKVTGIKGRA